MSFIELGTKVANEMNRSKTTTTAEKTTKGGGNTKTLDQRLLQFIIKDYTRNQKNVENYESLKAAGINVLYAMSIGSLIFGLSEGWRFIDSFWFSFVTLTTIGFGDFTPTLPLTRVFFVFWVIYGLGAMSVFLGEITDAFKRQREEETKAIARVRARRGDQEKKLKICSLTIKSQCIQNIHNSKLTVIIKCIVQFLLLLVIGGFILFLSEGYEYRDGIYFAFETSSTFGFGDQSLLYRYRGKIGNENGNPIPWSSIVIGNNETTGEVPAKDCLASKGRCAVDGTSCNCTFSDAAKYILMIYACISFAQLGILIEKITEYMYEDGNVGETNEKKEKVKIEGETEQEKEQLKDQVKDQKYENEQEYGHDKSSSGKKFSGSSKKCTKDKILPVIVFALSLVCYLLFGAGIFLAIEPTNFGNFRNAYYFAVISLTTIGYGDFTLITFEGKAFLIFWGIFGLAGVGFFLGKVQSALHTFTVSRVKYWRRCCCFSTFLNEWTDSQWLLFVVIMQTTVVYLIGNIGFLLSEVGIGQSGDFTVGGDNSTTWSPDVMLFYNIVTVTSIGYGANFYPRTAAGRQWILIYSWIALANMALVIDAVSNFVKARSDKRRSLVQQAMAEKTGLDELMSLLEEGEDEDE